MIRPIRPIRSIDPSDPPPPMPERRLTHDPVTGLPHVTIGFIPLTDCAAIVVAHERGLFRRHGVSVTLSREPSWSAIRDKVSVGLLDAAHMLAPMPLAATLGVDGLARPMVAAVSLGLSGNAITVSNDLYRRMCDADPDAMTSRATSARALRAVIEADRAADRDPLTFAAVFPFSSHNYQLRYWMASAGIDPDRDVHLVIVPPPQMVDRLESGAIDGYCVGEPWNALAVSRGLGHVAVTGYELWNNSPEKVLGVTEDWAAANPHTHQELVAAIIEAARWIDEPANRPAVAQMLARPEYVGAPVDAIRMGLTGHYQHHPDVAPEHVPDFNVFHRYAATFPWRSHAVWFMTQMARWGQIDPAEPIRHVAERVYLPDVYRAAARSLGLPAPMVDDKREGTHEFPHALVHRGEPIILGPNRFIDARPFNPAHPYTYLRGFAIRAERTAAMPHLK